jgi:hypothetical protein
MKVWKYALLTIGAEQMLELPGPIIFVGTQNTFVMLWCENRGPSAQRTFKVFGTGHDIPDGWVHVGSVQEPPFVWHVYEKVA